MAGKPLGMTARASSLRYPAAALALALALLWAALMNRFPLIFPDSGTYLGIAYGQEYAIDRSSYYGLLLKPFLTLLPGMAGLWLAIAAQALAVAAVLLGAARYLAPEATPTRLLLVILPAVLLTSLPWHAGQFMPDALTGPLVLLVWLAASRDPRGEGALLLWIAAVLMAITHYTHVALLVVAAAATIGAHAVLGLGVRAAARRAGAALAAAGAVLAFLTLANGAALGRWSPSPAGDLFLFARMNEDGLTGKWLDRHCGVDAPAPLCAERARLPVNSQSLLWGGSITAVNDRIWHPRTPAERWAWLDMMGEVNRAVLREQPLAFLSAAARGTARQLVSFAALDDECPKGCREANGGINFALLKYSPATVPQLQRSMQVTDETPKPLVRAVTSAVTALALLLLPIALLIAWRRREGDAVSLLGSVALAVLANAALAGALSDVHDRYQSRIVWLAPFALLLLAHRWWRRPSRTASAQAPRPAPALR